MFHQLETTVLIKKQDENRNMLFSIKMAIKKCRKTCLLMNVLILIAILISVSLLQEIYVLSIDTFASESQEIYFDAQKGTSLERFSTSSEHDFILFILIFNKVGSAVFGSLNDWFDKRIVYLKTWQNQAKNYLDGSVDSVIYRTSKIEEKRRQLYAWTVSNFLATMPQPQAGLIIGMVLGDDSSLGTQLRLSIKTIGMSHVVAASGFNVGLVAQMVTAVLGLWVVSRKKLHSLATTCAIAYCWFCGWSPSLVRAGLMLLFFTMSWWTTGRLLPAWYRLILTCLAIRLFLPETWGSISFQLSWWATAGIILLTGTRSLYGFLPIESNSIFGYLYSSAVTTCGAVLFTTPIVLTVFNTLPILSVLPNTLLLFLTPILTIVGALYLVLLLLMRIFFPIGEAAIPILFLPLQVLTSFFIVGINFFQWTGNNTLTSAQNLLTGLWCLIFIILIAKVLQRPRYDTSYGV